MDLWMFNRKEFEQFIDLLMNNAVIVTEKTNILLRYLHQQFEKKTGKHGSKRDSSVPEDDPQRKRPRFEWHYHQRHHHPHQGDEEDDDDDDDGPLNLSTSFNIPMRDQHFEDDEDHEMNGALGLR
jgi:hypothetical protein